MKLFHLRPWPLTHSLTDKLGRDTRGDHLFYLEVQDDSLNNGAHVAPDERGGNNRVH